MKNATKHADVLKSLVKKMPKEFRARENPKLDPVKAIVLGSLTFDATDADIDDALRRIHAEFFDYNELRVATELEVQELIGPKFSRVEDRAAVIHNALQGVFESESTLKLDRLYELKKADIRAYIHSLPAMLPYVESFVMLLSFDGNALPIDETAKAFLIDQGSLEPDTSLEDAQSFVEHHVKADDSLAFFYYLRDVAGAGRTKSKRK